MRRVNPARFTVATRGTSREINRSIALNLVRARQPISRADLARTMDVRRGAVTLIVNDLLREGLIFEGATGENVRGRKPTFLYIDSRRRAVVAADIRASETFLMLADLLGTPMTGAISFPTVRDPKELVEQLAGRVKKPARRSPGSRRMRRHRRGGARHGRALDDARAACADAGMAQRQSARARWRRRPGCPCRSKTPAAPARWRRRGRRARTLPAPRATSCSSACRTASASA